MLVSSCYHIDLPWAFCNMTCRSVTSCRSGISCTTFLAGALDNDGRLHIETSVMVCHLCYTCRIWSFSCFFGSSHSFAFCSSCYSFPSCFSGYSFHRSTTAATFSPVMNGYYSRSWRVHDRHEDCQKGRRRGVPCHVCSGLPTGIRTMLPRPSIAPQIWLL